MQSSNEKYCFCLIFWMNIRSFYQKNLALAKLPELNYSVPWTRKYVFLFLWHIRESTEDCEVKVKHKLSCFYFTVYSKNLPDPDFMSHQWNQIINMFFKLIFRKDVFISIVLKKIIVFVVLSLTARRWCFRKKPQ